MRRVFALLTGLVLICVLGCNGSGGFGGLSSAGIGSSKIIRAASKGGAMCKT